MCVWGGGGGGSTDRKNTLLVLQLPVGVQWFILRKTIIFKAPEGVQHFPGGGGCPTFFSRGGIQMLISIEIYITFQGGGSGPPIPFWIRACKLFDTDGIPEIFFRRSRSCKKKSAGAKQTHAKLPGDQLTTKDHLL